MNEVPILIVDDTPENLLVLKLTFKVLNIELHQCLSAMEAIDLCSKIEFAFIVLDVHMPKINGIEAAKKIRQTGKNTHTPILFLTADVYATDLIDEGYECGAVDFLFKPFNTKQLRAKANTFIDLYEQRIEAIEAKKVIEEQIQILVNSEKQQTVMKLSAGLSHNLNNRLTVVKGNVDYLSTELGYEPSWVVDVKDSLDECVKIVEALQGYAGYGFKLETERGSLRSVFENIQRLLGSSTTNENNSIIFESDDDSALLEVPSTLILDILVPMVINALQAVIADPTPVLLRSSLTQQELIIEVSDLGEGIDEETRDHIFEPFYSSRDLHESMGLGLSRVKGLIDYADGTIEVKANEPKGASFVVSLPLDKLENLGRDGSGVSATG
ncbi:MAG: response regulator [Gammaproteobacteria bacterium]|jgi:K+-sensing histidine kinase KdpD|nr:response regulator [Gammaproteobacteria bacterium]